MIKYISPSKLTRKGILGMNRRNHSYIGRYNDRSKYPLVDNKLKTKIIAQQAGCGVGLDMATGRAINGVQFDQTVAEHPDTKRRLSELSVPHWKKLLTLAASAWEMTGLGYMGTDMVLDKRHGPMVLELNARPGLAIQIANGTGLLPRLQRIEKLGEHCHIPSVEERVEYCMKHFSSTGGGSHIEP